MNGKEVYKLSALALTAAVVLAGSGCAKDGDDGYYEEKYVNPLAGRDVGGIDALYLEEGAEKITIENENIRIVLERKNGAVVEFVNKESRVYLTQAGDAVPVRINRIRSGYEVSDANYTDFEYAVEENSDRRKAVKMKWTYGDGIAVNATVGLGEGANEVVFRLAVENNALQTNDGVPSSCLYNVEYPIINNIDTLYQKETDYFLSPFTTGYLFHNPVGNFNGNFSGITKNYGLYPSGWEYPMQFQSYFSEGIGGFQFMTRDGGDTIKSFTFTGQNDKLRMSIYHYLSDVGKKDYSFDYDISIGNLTKGTWYESAEKYKVWALEQDWATKKGKLSQRTDIDKTFYEDTAMCNFCFPYTGEYTEAKQKALYETTKGSLRGGKILNVAFGNPDYYTDKLLDLSRNNKDDFVFFEFPDFHSVASANDNPAEWETAVKTFLSDTSSTIYNVNGVLYFYECASSQDYLGRFLEKQQSYYDKYGVSGYYHDVGVAAVHPKQCFNTAHAHGTRVNVVSDYVEQMKLTRELMRKNGGGIYGQELIFEQMLPYIDFYQARANAEELGWMESDRVRGLIEEEECEKVSLFDYVYGAYGATRLDGFLTADPAVGDGYYYVVAYTVLNGGIPEYNYEFFTKKDYLEPGDYEVGRMEYLGYLYNMRKSFGNEYLVYGDMTKPPKTGAESTLYDYTLTRFEGTKKKEGVARFDDVISTAYRKGEKIGVFLGNVTDSRVSLKFVIDALRDYGIETGTIALQTLDGKKELFQVEKGKAKIDLTLSEREVVLLEIGK